ncbi:MAG TPA: energy transducer TonB [Terriglobales bacterium]|nr:energy transducer TonB [Terriglobales bacterium]
MFQGTLLESSVQTPRRKRWPMATAFLLEIALGAALLLVPLASTGVIPVLAHAPIIAPLRSVHVTSSSAQTNTTAHGGVSHHTTEVVTIRDCVTCLHYGKNIPKNASDPEEGPAFLIANNAGPAGPNLIGNVAPPRPKPVERVRVSDFSEAQLAKRVEPVYPQIARVAGISGLVKLHAIIAKDGTIQSLSVISGHPLLARAAVEAVEQWQYRPYRLNGMAVEVETFITVNFKRER